jgi:hypothetical protein
MKGNLFHHYTQTNIVLARIDMTWWSLRTATRASLSGRLQSDVILQTELALCKLTAS